MRAVISLVALIVCGLFTDSSAATCAGRCGTSLDTSYTCQCNTACERFVDCCTDYYARCFGDPLSSAMQDIWNSDVNRFPSAEVDTNANGNRYFTSINETRFSGPTYAAFISLLDNYERNIGTPEIILDSNVQEINTFLNVVMATEGTSTVSGFHSWIQFYLQEKAGHVSFQSEVKVAQPSMRGIKFTWYGQTKTLGSFFMGTSPEFDFAVYSICALLHTNSLCNFEMQGHSVSIQTWDIGHKYGNQIGSAYPSI